jgi:CheY-like chemotaxis protein
MDILLPGINDDEVCEIVRLNPDYRNIKLISLTAEGRDVDIAEVMVLGADAYLTKLIRMQSLSPI